jgi:hypothetical protein
MRISLRVVRSSVVQRMGETAIEPDELWDGLLVGTVRRAD